MKRILISGLVVALLIAAVAISSSQKPAGKSELQVDIESRNPWTHLRLNNAPESFHFVVVSDRTGGNGGLGSALNSRHDGSRAAGAPANSVGQATDDPDFGHGGGTGAGFGGIGGGASVIGGFTNA